MKRRVYDALNVLIAADVLKKKGKHVISDEVSTLNGKSLNSNGRYEKGNYEELKVFFVKNLEIHGFIRGKLKKISMRKQKN